MILVFIFIGMILLGLVFLHNYNNYSSNMDCDLDVLGGILSIFGSFFSGYVYHNNYYITRMC